MERLRAPLYAQIELTYACNLGCGHCYNEPRFSTNSSGLAVLNRVKKESIENNRFLAIAEELAKHDVFAATLTGGEVFTVRERLYPTIEALARQDLEVTLNSNLTLTTEDDAKQLADLGVSGVMTSLISYENFE